LGFIVNENRGKRVLYVYNIQCCFRETNKLSVFLLNRPRPVAESTIPRGAHPHKSWPSRLYIYGWVYILYIYIEYYLARRREPPGWYIYMYDQIKRTREIFSSVRQRSRHKRQLFYMYNHPVVRAVCIGLLCVSRMFNVYKVPTVAVDHLFTGSRGRGWQNRVRENITFSVFDKTRNNIVFNTRKYKPPPSLGTILCIYCTVLYTLTRVAMVVWNLLFFDGFLISRTGFIMRVTNIHKSIIPKRTRFTRE